MRKKLSLHWEVCVEDCGCSETDKAAQELCLLLKRLILAAMKPQGMMTDQLVSVSMVKIFCCN
jgi:hypothetical protein